MEICPVELKSVARDIHTRLARPSRHHRRLSLIHCHARSRQMMHNADARDYVVRVSVGGDVYICVLDLCEDVELH